jgi:hypothetical protein
MGRMRSGHANVKPLTHWVIYKGYQVRFTERTAEAVRGVLTTPEGTLAFRYDPLAKVIHLPDADITINDYGWEVGSE